VVSQDVQFMETVIDCKRECGQGPEWTRKRLNPSKQGGEIIEVLDIRVLNNIGKVIEMEGITQGVEIEGRRKERESKNSEDSEFHPGFVLLIRIQRCEGFKPLP